MIEAGRPVILSLGMQCEASSKLKNRKRSSQNLLLLETATERFPRLCVAGTLFALWLQQLWLWWKTVWEKRGAKESRGSAVASTVNDTVDK